MAEILIKGMHLPKVGYVTTITLFHDGTVHDRLGNVQTCKAQELPPHGQLIDADKLRERAYAIQRRDRISFTDALAMALIEAETIVEANNG